KALRAALVDDRDLDCRRMAAISLGRCGHPSAAAALIKALDENPNEDRAFVAIGLGLLARAKPDPKISDVLSKAIAKGGSDEGQGSLSLACGLAGVQAARPRIADILDNGGPTAGPLA